MKDKGGGVGSNQYKGIWLHHGSNWPSDQVFNPQQDKITARINHFNEGTIYLNNIKIDNNDPNNPDWTSGTFDVSYNGEIKSFDNKMIPFGFLMDDDSFYKKVEELCY